MTQSRLGDSNDHPDFRKTMCLVSKGANNDSLSKKLESKTKWNENLNQTCPPQNDSHQDFPSTETRKQTGLCKQLAYYPRNGDGSVREPARIANYSQMEHSGGTQMASEFQRLRTFRNWPSDSCIQPADLAKSGFYYDDTDAQHNDRVKCAFCRGVLHSWEVGDEPIKEHRRGFSTCPFMLSMSVGNIPIRADYGQIPKCLTNRPDGSSRCTAKCIPMPAMTLCHNSRFKWCDSKLISLKYRIHTFACLGKISSKIAKELSSCGFFYKDQGNTIECFKCHFQSEIDDSEAIRNHASNKPICPFLRQRKLQAEKNSGSPVLSNMTPKLTDSEILTRMDSWAVRQVLNLGHHYDMVKYVVLKYVHFNGENFLMLDELIRDIELLNNEMKEQNIDAEDEERAILAWDNYISVREGERRNRMKKEYERLMQKVKESPNMVSNLMDDPQFKERIVKLSAEDLEYQEVLNKHLKAEQYCKICMDKPVEVVFIPCHHILSCVSCTSNMRFCPVCCSPIESTIQTSCGVT